MDIATIVVLLIAGHFLADYALQGDFMAKAKNHRTPIPGVPWATVLGSHAAIHGATVFLITGSPVFGGIELVGHALIDYAKCDGRISYNVDQALHVAMKCAYVAAMLA